ncbi:hypothetical protein [Rhizorhabdus argentea]|uniref:hypothetical protein n=1 Tax=Rhizorhabdus argentea TaxID=1387174 RepID=UPI0030ECA188
MALPEFKTTNIIDTALRAGPRPTQDGDGPITSPVHALQQRVERNVVLVPGYDVRLSGTRISLYIVAPLVLWAGILKVLPALF